MSLTFMQDVRSKRNIGVLLLLCSLCLRWAAEGTGLGSNVTSTGLNRPLNVSFSNIGKRCVSTDVFHWIYYKHVWKSLESWIVTALTQVKIIQKCHTMKWTIDRELDVNKQDVALQTDFLNFFNKSSINCKGATATVKLNLLFNFTVTVRLMC